MKVFELIDRLQLFNKLVEERKTGTPEEFAERLGIKRRTLYEFVDELKSHNVPISYSRVSKTSFYTRAVDFKLSTVVNADRLVVLDGGKVVEQGIPNQLRQQEGFFRRMLQNQGIGE